MRSVTCRITLGLAPRLPFAIRTQNDSGCGTQADDRILREMGAEAATIQAKDAKGAENERDPVQDDAQQMSQAYAVHERFVNATNLATFQMANEMRSGQNYRLAFAEILSHLRPNTAIVEDLPLDRKGRFYEVESLVAYPISVWALRMDP